MASSAMPHSNRDSIREMSVAAVSFYDGWMTGWSFEACRHLFFRDDPQGLPAAEKAKLLSWISTYRNLIHEWRTVDMDEVTKEFDGMEEQVRGRASRGEPITKESFESHFEEVKGGIRARAPYAYYTALFASYASRLRFPRQGDERPVLIESMRVFLSNLEGVLPPGAFGVIDDDLKAMKKAGGSPGGGGALKNRIQVWSDLIFGTIGVDDVLNKTGSVVLLLSIAGAGLGLFLLVGGIIFGVYEIIQGLPGFDAQALNLLSLGNVSSFIQNVVPAAAALGLSTGLLAMRAWDAVQTFEVWVAVQIASVPQFRKREVSALIG